ncbi:MAG: hypothetical protein ACJ735_13770 [Actinomycetes bacterium]
MTTSACTHRQGGANGSPSPESVPTQAGTIYVALGANPLNAQIYRFNGPAQAGAKLTSLPPNEGASTVSAAGHFIVIASTVGFGRDRPYLLNGRGGMTNLWSRAGYAPVVSPRGDVAWLDLTMNNRGATSYGIDLLRRGDRHPMVVRHGPAGVGPAAWAGDNTLAILQAGSPARVLLIDAATRHVLQALSTDIENPTYLTASVQRVVATGDTHQGELISSSGKRTRLAQGWGPVAFSPDGTELLVVRNRTELGIVQVDHPDRVSLWRSWPGQTVLDAAWS